MLKLVIDLFLKLPEVKIKRNRDYYIDFITKFEDAFRRLHQNYIDSFAKYRKLLMEIDFPVDDKSEIINVIRNDSLFSEHIRADLYPMANHKQDKRIGPFVKAVEDYLNCASNSPERHLTFKKNDFRFGMIQTIRPYVVDIVLSKKDQDRIEEDRKREARIRSEIYRIEATKQFDELLRRIQGNYKKVVMSLDVVKRELLTNDMAIWKKNKSANKSN